MSRTLDLIGAIKITIAQTGQPFGSAFDVKLNRRGVQGIKFNIKQ